MQKRLTNHSSVLLIHSKEASFATPQILLIFLICTALDRLYFPPKLLSFLFIARICSARVKRSLLCCILIFFQDNSNFASWSVASIFFIHTVLGHHFDPHIWWVIYIKNNTSTENSINISKLQPSVYWVWNKENNPLAIGWYQENRGEKISRLNL